MKQFKAKPQKVNIFVQAHEGQRLMDLRRGRKGLLLGIIPDIGNQYGAKVVKKDDGFIFSGKSHQIQLLVEKLHFAGVRYFEL